MSILALEQMPARATEEMFPYETSDFHECWWRTLSPKFDILHQQQDLLIHRKRFFKGMLALNEARIAGWNSAWSQDLTLDRVENLMRLEQEYDWDYFRFTWAENRQDKQHLEAIQKAKYPVLHLETSPQYLIDLRDGFENYLDSHKSFKKKIRLAEKLSPSIVPVTQESEITPCFQELFSYHIPYWKEKLGSSYFSDLAEQQFIIAWSKALYRQGVLRLDRFTMAGETTNLSMGMLFGKTYYWLLTINTGLHQVHSPGIVGLKLRVKALAEQGLETFNMGSGHYAYKMQSANRLNPCKDILIFNPRSFKAKVYYQWMCHQAPKNQVEPL